MRTLPLILMLLAGCGDDDRLPPPAIDGGGLDAAPRDAASLDSTVADGSTGDAASVDDAGPQDSGPPPCWRVQEIAAASDHTCAISDGALYCWGDNDRGQLGMSGPARSSPTRVGTEDDWTDVSAGVDYGCGLRGTQIHCWGHNQYGRLGVGDEIDRDAPTPVDRTETFDTLTAGPFHACAIDTDGQLFCWGHNASGRLGVGDETDRDVPTLVGTGWVAVSPGGAHTCGRKDDDTIWCWGGNDDGQLGQGDEGFGTERNTPVQVGAMDGWFAISAGNSHACATRLDGTLHCWGSNGVGQLGLGTTPARVSTPTRVGTAATWSSVRAGPLRACANGPLSCWGANGSGQLGTGDTDGRDMPAEVVGFGTAVRIALGTSHTCALTPENAMSCWGRNGAGQLGLGDTSDRLTPEAVCPSL